MLFHGSRARPGLGNRPIQVVDGARRPAGAVGAAAQRTRFTGSSGTRSSRQRCPSREDVLSCRRASSSTWTTSRPCISPIGAWRLFVPAAIAGIRSRKLYTSLAGGVSSRGVFASNSANSSAGRAGGSPAFRRAVSRVQTIRAVLASLCSGAQSAVSRMIELATTGPLRVEGDILRVPVSGSRAGARPIGVRPRRQRPPGRMRSCSGAFQSPSAPGGSLAKYRPVPATR